MNHPNYIGTLRNNLCCALIAQKENKEKIKKINDAIESIEAVPDQERPLSTESIIDELFMSIDFCEELNSVYEKEVSRIIAILLKKTQTEIR